MKGWAQPPAPQCAHPQSFTAWLSPAMDVGINLLFDGGNEDETPQVIISSWAGSPVFLLIPICLAWLSVAAGLAQTLDSGFNNFIYILSFYLTLDIFFFSEAVLDTVHTSSLISAPLKPCFLYLSMYITVLIYLSPSMEWRPRKASTVAMLSQFHVLYLTSFGCSVNGYWINELLITYYVSGAMLAE